MTTAAQICAAAAKHLGVLDPEETLSGSELSHLMGLLISLLDQWQVEPSMSAGTVELSITPTAGAQSFTVGPSGDVVARQPQSIVTAKARVNGIDTPLEVKTIDFYDAEASKTVQGMTQYVVLDRAYDTATVFLWPAADGLTQVRLLVLQDVLTSYANIVSTDTLTMPSGMRNALEWALAKEGLTDYSVDPATAAEIKSNAANAKRLFGRSNAKRRVLNHEWTRAYDINIG